MTAEVAILNQRAVALAADSAVAIGSGKVFFSADKLFALSKYEPVGIMVFGNADIVGVPCEIVIKRFRQQLGRNSKGKLADYAKDLLVYIDSDTVLCPMSQQEVFVRNEVEAIADRIQRDAFQALMKQNTPPEPAADFQTAYQSALKAQIGETRSQLESLSTLTDIHGTPFTEQFIGEAWEKYSSVVESVFQSKFGFLSALETALEDFRAIGRLAIYKQTGVTAFTGIVVAGYGEEELFPQLCSFRLFGTVNGRLRCLLDTEKNVEISSQRRAEIVPFAQTDMVQSFIYGVDPIYQETVDSIVSTGMDSFQDALVSLYKEEERDQVRNVFGEIRKDVMKRLGDSVIQARQERYGALLNVVASLPKAELANFAESLLNLTSMKRHISTATETVGGPIDVALLSKGDGFIWIKRKHYFERELNYQFFENYFRKEENRGT